jgi:predicted GH43/DUF377 family glycosyl hydrolase
MFSHASAPVPYFNNDGTLRIYFSCRDERNYSHTAFIDIDPNNMKDVAAVSKQPVLAPNVAGRFDDCGTSVSCITSIDNKTYMYYVGWSKSFRLPFLTFLGLSCLNSDKIYAKRYMDVPLLDRNDDFPDSVGYASIVKTNKSYIMWYEQCNGWYPNTQSWNFSINCATSSDGIIWERRSKPCLQTISNQTIIARPSVLKDQEIYKMWYSYKSENINYRIGYAESDDGFNWVRKDDGVGIDISDSGWDDEQVCYPYVFDYNNERYMLYNGNGYGKSGIGIAILN